MRFYLFLILSVVFGLNTLQAAFACGCGCANNNCGTKVEAPKLVIEEKLYCEEIKKIVIAQKIENKLADSNGCKGNCNNGGK